MPIEYRVLARKYRPTTFADLIGQEVLVRTLTNAIQTGRVHHAFLLTGIRGVGKTTTARIIARALNCEQGPTPTPCGVCAHCAMLAEDRHPDVLEMDAASRTGVGDIRELLETVHYAPATARYKIYIIDEVHMLSTSAFNALLKTLEEPPPHVKFIFATTEVRKIPVTILSRCQRFDLRRVPTETLAAHLGNIAGKEGATFPAEALTLIAQAAEGSVRDGLSLLDQAIAQAAPGEAIDEAWVRNMLGLADRGQVLDVLEDVAQGKAESAVNRFRQLYKLGADPLLTLQDLLELTHFITRIRLNPQAADDITYAAREREKASTLATALSMPSLTRLWQMLLKGVTEVRFAPSPAAAAEMVLVRAAYASDLPTPAEAIRALHNAPQTRTREPTPPAPIPPAATPAAAPAIVSYEGMIALLEQEREALLASKLRQFASLVEFAPLRLHIHLPIANAREFSSELAQALHRITNQPWRVSLSDTPGQPTLLAQVQAQKEERKREAAADPLVADMLAQFPGAEIVDVKETA